jgi:polyhydroxyalkanoate synthesis repressor PhaR
VFEMSEPEATIVIKRYASRRLYNTDTSEYVTLEEIATLIRQGKNIRIVDSKTGDDLTRQFLMQIITEQETGSESVLPLNVLMDVVRSYNDQTSSVVPDFLSKSFELLKNQQEEMLSSMQKHTPQPVNPMEIFSLESWQKAQAEIMNSTLGSWGLSVPQEHQPEPPAEPEPQNNQPSSNSPSDSPKDQDVADIKKQLAEMQEKLKNL